MTTELAITEHGAAQVERANAAEKRAMPDTEDVQPGASDRGDGAGRLDAVAGCEFVDDRIRTSKASDDVTELPLSSSC